MIPPEAAPMREDVTQGEWHACPAHWGQADIVTFDDVRNSTSTMNGRIYREIVPYIDIADAKFIVAAVNAYRLAHTARPDAGELREAIVRIERFVSLMVPQMSLNFRRNNEAEIVRMANDFAELRAAHQPGAGEQFAESAKSTDAGDEVERVARAISRVVNPWDQAGDQWEGYEAEARAALAAMREGVDRGMVANREAVALIDEINLRAESRQFWGIGQTLHAKLCTIRATLARAAALSRKGG